MVLFRFFLGWKSCMWALRDMFGIFSVPNSIHFVAHTLCLAIFHFWHWHVWFVQNSGLWTLNMKSQGKHHQTFIGLFLCLSMKLVIQILSTFKFLCFCSAEHEVVLSSSWLHYLEWEQTALFLILSVLGCIINLLTASCAPTSLLWRETPHNVFIVCFVSSFPSSASFLHDPAITPFLFLSLICRR